MKKYILGLLSGLVFVPILESFIDVVCVWMEVLKAKASCIITEYNQKIRTGNVEDDGNAIGFQIPSNTLEYEDEDEYYDDDEY